MEDMKPRMITLEVTFQQLIMLRRAVWYAEDAPSVERSEKKLKTFFELDNLLTNKIVEEKKDER